MSCNVANMKYTKTSKKDYCAENWPFSFFGGTEGLYIYFVSVTPYICIDIPSN